MHGVQQRLFGDNTLHFVLGAVVLAACTPTTETVTVEGEAVEVTRIVTETVVETVEPEAGFLRFA